MNATINLEKHFPVLLNELVSIISPLYGGTFIDCTFGAGGYSKKILENNLNNILKLIAILVPEWEPEKQASTISI